MKLFGRGEAEAAVLRQELADMRRELDRVSSRVTLLQTEQDTVHTEVRKWMRRAVAAERRAAPVPDGEDVPSVQVRADVAPRRRLWGARARIAARRTAAALPAVNGSGGDAEVEDDDGSDS